MDSAHDHGNCQLCDLLANVIVKARDENTALQARVRYAQHNGDCHLAAPVMACGECRRYLHCSCGFTAALAPARAGGP